jgi:hypothetical protein
MTSIHSTTHNLVVMRNWERGKDERGILPTIWGWNTATQEGGWLRITPDYPAEFIGCIGAWPRYHKAGYAGADERIASEDTTAIPLGCTGVDELIRYRGEVYVVQASDLEDYACSFANTACHERMCFATY